MIIDYNSQNLFFKKPFGAVLVDETVRFRVAITGGGIAKCVKIYLIYPQNEQSYDMAYVFSIGGACIYEAKIKMPETADLVFYYFYADTEMGKGYYGNNCKCLSGTGEFYENKPCSLYQITVYDKNYKVPDWFKKSVVYQIFPDRFYNANKDGTHLGTRQDIIKRNWGEVPYYKPEQFGGKYKANDFFGGNLKGIEEKLPYLKSLGIDVIYLNPIFKAYSNHKYDTGDYLKTDESFGTTEDFERLCKTAQGYSIRIILDGVFNHTGSDSKYFNKNGSYDEIGAYQSKKSPYYYWYSFNEYPDNYDSWWGIDTLPAVNEKSESYQDFIYNKKDSVVRYWLKKGASGWRLDVVDELPDFFVEGIKKSAKEEKKDSVIIGEVWEDASNKISYGERRRYFLGNELDSVMNYPLKNAVVDFCKNIITAEEFDKRFMSLCENYPKEAFYSCLNILSTHDIPRIITELSDCPKDVSKDFMAKYRLNDEEYKKAKERLVAVSTFIMALPGVPCIYYGDEIGMQGYADPFSRGCYDWENGDNELINHYKSIISVRKKYCALIDGEYITVYKNDYQYAFLRKSEEKAMLVIVNFSDTQKRIRLDLQRYGICTINCIFGVKNRYEGTGIFYVEADKMSVNIYQTNN